MNINKSHQNLQSVFHISSLKASVIIVSAVYRNSLGESTENFEVKHLVCKWIGSVPIQVF